MKIMFCILGEGRGHLTQAMAMKEMVERAGHSVVSVVLGAGSRREVAPFFASAMKMPVRQIPTLEFAYKNNRNVSLPASVWLMARRAPAYAKALAALHAEVRACAPDVIVNFFEPLTGLYALLFRDRPPVVAVAHQFMIDHPAYLRAPGRKAQQWGMKWYVRLVGANSTRIALSLYHAPDRPERDTVVAPPILRPALFALEPARGDFVLAYLLNHGYAGQIHAWHRKNPGVRLHCFYDKPGAPAEERIDDTLTFHRLDGEKFLRMMAQCKQVACTAGFESLAEAAWLGKPLFLVPVENHIEQEINALDAVRCGIAVTDSSFNLDRLAELPARLDNAAYRDWVKQAEGVFLRVLENAAAPASRAEVQPVLLDHAALN